MKPFVVDNFELNSRFTKRLANQRPAFDAFGAIVFYRTYSRVIEGMQENWHDVVRRIINGTFSIRKDWYKKANIKWDEDKNQKYAEKMGQSLFNMEWMPGGRGLWAMGTQFVYDRGSMALNNCGATKLGGNDRLANDYHWMMDALMLGVGVGFEPIREALTFYRPVGEFYHYVQDSREGWCDGLRLLMNAFLKPNQKLPMFRFDYVRGKGQPIKGFGGLSSGPEPLIKLYQDVEYLLRIGDKVDVVRLKSDIANMIGVCVVAGNVRRSAELAKGRVTDQVFLDLKDYEKYPEREDWGYMSNNTVALFDDIDFQSLGEVAHRVVTRGEPGVMNLRNFPYGRIGKSMEGLRPDKADLLNPCGEVPLEDKELCNVAETLPTVCPNRKVWLNSTEYASFYASTVSLLPTHRAETNEVVLRNRRIAVGIIDWTGWFLNEGMHNLIRDMRDGYKRIRETNSRANGAAGVPDAIRVTTIKPGGTTPKLASRTPGIGYPTFRETLRRMRVAANNPICPLLDKAGVPYEPCFHDPSGTRIYAYPTLQGPSQPADTVSLWEQAFNLITVQAEWADNAVSNTLYFRPKWRLELFRDAWTNEVWEEVLNEVEQFADNIRNIYVKEHGWSHQNDKLKLKVRKNKWDQWEFYVWVFDPNHEEDIIEKVISMIVPHIKSCSLLPHSAKGAYRQMPEEGITAEEYKRLKAKITEVNWTDFSGSDGEDEKYCSGPTCTVPI